MKFNQTSKQYRQLNDFIRGEMGRQHISQASLAYMMNLPQQSISARLTGKVDWTLWEVLNIFEILGVEFTYEKLEGAKDEKRIQANQKTRHSYS